MSRARLDSKAVDSSYEFETFETGRKTNAIKRRKGCHRDDGAARRHGQPLTEYVPALFHITH